MFYIFCYCKEKLHRKKERMQKVLNIFDFDGTLFRSPEASSKLWVGALLGKIKGPPSQSGLGWFQELITLQPPYVPEDPDVSWFNAFVLDKCRQSIADPNSITVLLTGRLTIYSERIRHIVSCMGLEFDHYGLKPGPYLFTMDFKIGFVHDLVSEYAGQLNKIVLYDDREEHSSRFTSLLKGTKLPIEVIAVEPDVTYLPREQEIEVVHKLIEKNGANLKLIETPAYTGIMLDDESHASLLSWIPIPDNWIVQAHHMTVAFGTQEIPEGANLHIGSTVSLTIEAIGFDTRALAVQVSGAASTNSIAHVTIAHSPLDKPADSNNIISWIPLSVLSQQNGVLVQELASKEKQLDTTQQSPIQNAQQNVQQTTEHNTEKDPQVTEVTQILQASQVTTTTSTSTTTIVNDGATSVTTTANLEVTSTTQEPLQQQQPLLRLQTKFPETAPRIQGVVHVRTVFGIAPHPPRLVEPRVIPKGVNIGDVIRKYHPEAKGKQIGDIVKQAKEYCTGKEVTDEELEDFVKNLTAPPN